MPSLVAPAIPPGSLSRLPQPELHLHDVVLRPWRASDVTSVTEAYSEPTIQYWHAKSMTDDEAAAWIAAWPDRWEQETGGGWAVVNESGIVGQISLRRMNLAEGLADVSYWVTPAARGRRVATHALSALSEWVFDELRLHRVEVAHSTLNPASCKVATYAGFAFEGTKRREALHTDGWHDMHLHARLIDDGDSG